MRARRLLAATVPVAMTIATLGGACRKETATTTTAMTTATATAMVTATATAMAMAAASASAEAEPTVDASIAGDADDAGDAATDAAETGDAKGDAKPDAFDNAPLMGAATFFDEVEMRGLRKITVDAARVHKAPKDKTILATLAKGTEVSLVAQLGEWCRVRYTDPGSQIRRQGWIFETTFAGPRRKSCPDGWTHHDGDGGWCDRECKTNRDCRGIAGYKCSGTLCFYAGP
jgi:hypothetical protein